MAVIREVRIKIMKYTVESDDGVMREFNAKNVTSAVEKSTDWIAGGNWGDQKTYVEFTITDEDGNEEEHTVVVGGPDEPVCLTEPESEK